MDRTGLENEWEELPNQQDYYEGEERGEGEATAPQAESVDDISAQPFPDLSVLNESSAEDAVQENVVTHSNLYRSEDMYNLESGPEDEEKEDFLILDPDHPLVRRRRAACKKALQEHREKVKLALKEKLELLKAKESHVEETSCHMFRKQEQLARQRKKLMDDHEATAQAQTKHQQAQERLEETTYHYDHTTKEHSKAETSVSCLQATLDKLTQHLLSTQEVNKDLSSKVKTQHNVTRKATSRRTQAEEQKLKQDCYVERLTLELERLTEQKSMLEAYIRFESEETEAVKESLSEVDMNLEVLMMMQKQLTEQWNSSLLALRKQDEACSSMQEAVRDAEHKLVLVQREIEGYRKSITEEQEKNEMLMTQLKWSEMNNSSSRKLIAQKENQRETLLRMYRTVFCALKETELVQDTFDKKIRSLQSELNNQRKQMEKNVATCLKQDNRIMTHLQQRLSHTSAAKYSKRLTDRKAALRKEKKQQLVQKENELMAERLTIQQVEQRVSGLTYNQEAFKEQLTKQAKMLTLSENKISSLNTLIEQNQVTITNYNNRISQIMANTGQDDLSPMHSRIQGIIAQSDELNVIIKTSKQQWMKQQDILVRLSEELEATRREIRRLQISCTAMQQREIKLDRQSELQQQEAAAIIANENVLHRDRTKLCSFLSKSKQLSQALRQENALMETEFIRQLKEAERESFALQAKHEKIQEDKDLLLNSLLEAEHQVMLWERKTQLMKETQAVLNTEWGKEDRQKMKAEIHLKEVQLGRLMKQQGKLLKEGDVAAHKWVNNVQRGCHRPQASSKKKPTKGGLVLTLQGLRRQIKDTKKLVADCNQVMNVLQQSYEDLSIRIKQHREQNTELCETNDTLTFDLVNLQNSKDTNLAHLQALQGRRKKLQSVCVGSYRASSNSQSVAAAQQNMKERLHSLSSILHQVCDKFPQHQGALSKLSQSLAAHTQSHRGRSK